MATPPPPAPKPFWQSRTIWLNALTVVATMASVFIEVLLDAGTVITWATVATGLLAAINVYLRTGTSQAITINSQATTVGGTQTNIGSVTAQDDALLGSTENITVPADARNLAPAAPLPFRAGYYVLSGHYTAPLAGGGALLVPLRSDALYLSRADAHAVTHAADLPAGWTWDYCGAAEPSGALPNGGNPHATA